MSYQIRLQNGSILSWKTIYEVIYEAYIFDWYDIPIITNEVEAKELAFMYKGEIELCKNLL